MCQAFAALFFMVSAMGRSADAKVCSKGALDEILRPSIYHLPALREGLEAVLSGASDEMSNTWQGADKYHGLLGSIRR